MTEFDAPSTKNQFDVAQYPEQWKRYKELRPLAAEFTKLHKRFKELFGAADEIVHEGTVVATNSISGKFQPSQLKTDHPHLYAAYTKPVVREEFDEEAFKASSPDMWNFYRSRSVRHLNEEEN